MTARRPASVLAAAALALAAISAPQPARAFCGFYVSGSSEGLYNKATRVALMRQGTRTVLTMSNDYDGPPQDFAMVVPVPVVLQRENVRTLPHDVFDHLESLTAPRLVEYWEQDPCAPEERMYDRASAAPPSPTSAESESTGDQDLGVRVEARFAVGEYEVVILSANESSGLETWLHRNRYNIPRGAAAFLAPYVRGQWKFFVARVDIERAQRRAGGSHGVGVRLSPLRMHYDATEFRLPVRLGLLNAPPGAQDLIVYVLHGSSRFEVANYRNAFIPTNLDVRDGVREQFPAFYGKLFDATLQAAGQRAVVTEYAWSTSSCDPCPTPPLEANELATLGADVLEDVGQYNMVVTRLHTRYNGATLTDDLVFREATPIAGGREHVVGANGQVEQGAQPSSYGNNFQARYVIRHAWTGPVACANPRRGVWGGRPGGGAGPTTTAARDLASAPRSEALQLSALVLTPTPGVDLDAPLALPPAPPPAQISQPPLVPSTGVRRGCACRTSATSGCQDMSHGTFGALAALAALGLVRRRRGG